MNCFGRLPVGTWMSPGCGSRTSQVQLGSALIVVDRPRYEAEGANPIGAPIVHRALDRRARGVARAGFATRVFCRTFCREQKALVAPPQG